MLRITTIGPDDNPILRLEGRLIEPWTQELEASFCAQDPPPILDLSAVRFADAAGLDLLRRLREEGAELAELSPLLRSLLDGAGR